MHATSPRLPDIIEERLPGPMRVALAIGGLTAVFAPLLELGPAIWPLNLTTPFFLVIVIGAASVGLPMFAAAAANVGTRWTLESHALKIEFLAIGFARDWRFHYAQGATADLHIDDEVHAERAHRVVVRAPQGKHFYSPPFPTKAQAEAYLARVKARLGGR